MCKEVEGNRYKEISLANLFIHVCQRWRFILICLIIGVIAVGGYGALESGGSISAETVSDDAGFVAGSKLTDERRQVVEMTANSIKKYTQLRDNQEDWNENSLYMQLDPYNLITGELKFYIDNNQTTEWNNQLSALVQAYAMTLSVSDVDDAMSQMILNIYNVEEERYHYYRDLVYTDTGSQGVGILSVKIYGDTAKNVESMAEAVKTIISENEDEINDSIGEHTISLLGENIYKNINITVRDCQANYSQVVIDYNTKITNLKATITDSTEKTYLEYLLENEDDTDAGDVETVAKTSGLTIRKAGMYVSGKYIGIGAILGIIIAIILIIIKYVATSVIKTHDELEKYLNIPVLTRMDGDSDFSRKHKTSFDKWLREKKLRHRHNMSYEENVDLVVAKIEIATTKNNLKNICLATDLDCDEKYAKDIIAKLNGKVETIYIKNFLAKADALQNLSQTDGVVLIEQTEISKYQDIVEEIQLCSKYDINIIGAIVLE